MFDFLHSESHAALYFEEYVRVVKKIYSSLKQIERIKYLKSLLKMFLILLCIATAKLNATLFLFLFHKKKLTSLLLLFCEIWYAVWWTKTQYNYIFSRKKCALMHVTFKYWFHQPNLNLNHPNSFIRKENVDTKNILSAPKWTTT